MCRQVFVPGKHHCCGILQVNKALLPPVATLWHLIPSAFRLLELVGIHGLVTHIVEDNSGTSEYSRDWSGEGIATEMSTRDFMGNMIGAIEQFRAALGNLTLLTSVKCSTEVNFISKNGLFLHKLIECDEGLIFCTVRGMTSS